MPARGRHPAHERGREPHRHPLGPAAVPSPGASARELNLSCSPTDVLPVALLFGLEELGALLAVLPLQQVALIARKQLRRVAVETGLIKYSEVTSVLAALERG